MGLRIFILLFMFNLSAQAEKLILCKTSLSCKCPLKTDSAFPTEFRFEDKNVVACRPLVTELTVILNAPPDASVTCPDPSPDTLFDQVTSTFPKDCGYVWKNFDRRSFIQTVHTYVNENKILCDQKDHHSMCTSATFLAFLKAVKNLKEKGLVTDEQLALWSDLDDGPAWNFINHQARPDLLLEELNLGVGKTLRKNEIPNPDWPKEGDLLQFWREDDSGHSTVFAGYLKNAAGKTEAVCYWSANSATNGYGKMCEPLEDVNRMIIGRFNP